MKKAKFVLTFIVVSAAIGGTLAAKAKKIFGGVNYFTTAVFNAVATATFTSGKTTIAAQPGAINVFYTTIDNSRATAAGWLTKTVS